MKSAYRKGVRVGATVAPIIRQDLDDLLETGLFGRTRAEIVQRFIYNGVRENIAFLRPQRRIELPNQSENQTIKRNART